MGEIVIELKDNAPNDRIVAFRKDLHKLNQVSRMDDFGAYMDIIKSIKEVKSEKKQISLASSVQEIKTTRIRGMLWADGEVQIMLPELVLNGELFKDGEEVEVIIRKKTPVGKQI